MNLHWNYACVVNCVHKHEALCMHPLGFTREFDQLLKTHWGIGMCSKVWQLCEVSLVGV